MKKLQSVHPDDRMRFMEQLTEELRPFLQSPPETDEKRVQLIFLGTLYQLTLDIFDWLPPEQQSEIMTACGTWLNVGLLMGRYPTKLVDILKKVNPRLIDTEIPDWVIKPSSAK